MPRQSSPPPTPEAIVQQCYQLSLPELYQLQDAIAVLIQAEKQEQAQATESWDQKRETKLPHTGARGSRGYIELKRINGYGPYAYLRFRSGDTHHSFYLGKAKTYAAERFH